jgi:hypothetical protein
MYKKTIYEQLALQKRYDDLVWRTANEGIRVRYALISYRAARGRQRLADLSRSTQLDTDSRFFMSFFEDELRNECVNPQLFVSIADDLTVCVQLSSFDFRFLFHRMRDLA